MGYTRSKLRRMYRRVFPKGNVLIVDLSAAPSSTKQMWIIRAQKHVLLKGKMGGLYYFTANGLGY